MLIYHLTLLLTVVTLTLAGCVKGEFADKSDPENLETVETPTQVYECNNYEFSVDRDRQTSEVTLYLPGRKITLKQVRAASGAKYQNQDVLFWNKGDRALLEIEGKTFNNCRRNSQRQPRDPQGKRPVDFRAIGNEPAWLLEIVDDHSIRMLTDYGNNRVVTPAPSPQLFEGKKIYAVETEAHKMRVTIQQKTCTDTMSGEQFESQVMVHLDDQTFIGCGQSLS